MSFLLLPKTPSNQGDPCFFDLKIIIPSPEDKAKKGVEGLCRNFHLLIHVEMRKIIGFEILGVELQYFLFLFSSSFIPLCTVSYILF